MSSKGSAKKAAPKKAAAPKGKGKAKKTGTKRGAERAMRVRAGGRGAHRRRPAAAKSAYMFFSADQQKTFDKSTPVPQVRVWRLFAQPKKKTAARNFCLCEPALARTRRGGRGGGPRHGHVCVDTWLSRSPTLAVAAPRRAAPRAAPRCAPNRLKKKITPDKKKKNNSTFFWARKLADARARGGAARQGDWPALEGADGGPEGAGACRRCARRVVALTRRRAV